MKKFLKENGWVIFFVIPVALLATYGILQYDKNQQMYIGETYNYCYDSDLDNPFNKINCKKIKILDKKDGYILYSDSLETKSDRQSDLRPNCTLIKYL